MGLPIKKLYVTNIGDESGDILFTADFIPEKREDGKYYIPKGSPIGFDMFISNILNITEEDGSVPVKIVKSNIETGLWLACFDGFFASEKYLFNRKPKFIEYTNNIDWDDFYKNNAEDWPIHVCADINMKQGDLIPVTLEEGHVQDKPIVKKESLFKKLFKKI